ncbi:MAG TPA: hypothetical protein PKE55_08950 [Kiritimatiellia bacterium]|nr:hypothetical protein [Kiritimatiellia bacterium]
MPLINIGGIRWNPHLVGWGVRGRPRKDVVPGKDLSGYSPKKDGKGKLSDEERTKRTISFWNCHAVYALFERGQSIYIGEGKLGDRLFQHWRTDTLVGRWDSFSWVSPDRYILEADGSAKIEKADDHTEHKASTKEWIELLELIAIRLGSPEANSQMPKAVKNITWINQAPSIHAEGDIDAKVDKILSFIEAQKNGKG